MIVALVVAGGKSNRFKAEIPKQFISLNGTSIIERTVQTFLDSLVVDQVFCVIPIGFEQLYNDAFQYHAAPEFFYGGESRQESVYKGLLALRELKPAKILIHDAARPLVSQRIVLDIVEALKHYNAVDVGIAVVDTIKKKGMNIEILNRDELYYEFIMNAHTIHKANTYGDDITLAIMENEPIYLVQGEKINFKITTPEDIKLAQLYLENDV
jgi:2-C-methyl-D-erythritol 4-phosphate cytidylyltransferase